MSTAETHEARIARQEEYWTAPRLFAFGFAFLGACITWIYIMASL